MTELDIKIFTIFNRFKAALVYDAEEDYYTMFLVSRSGGPIVGGKDVMKVIKKFKKGMALAIYLKKTRRS